MILKKILRGLIILSSNLVAKTALDKNGVKLGKIIREDSVLTDNLGIKEYFAVIRYQIFPREVNYSLPLDSYEILSIDDKTVTFNITQKQFQSLIKQLKLSRKIRAKSAKFGEADKNDQAAALSYRMKF